MKKIVTIGGGTGSFMLLSGLKKYPISISAIVSMTDDGGSTGILRDELGVLPPGDIRQCLVALSDSPKKLRDLMNFRFGGEKLKGHSFGNLLLSALEKINGDFSKAIETASEILNVKGQVVPVTLESADIRVMLKDGNTLNGEHELNMSRSIERIGIRKYGLFPEAKANPKALQKISEAQVIVIGPGNHYCSVLPNLAVKGIAKAIKKSRAKVIYNCNLVNKKGHTEKYNLDDYADAVNRMIGKERIDFVTFNARFPTGKLVRSYEKKGEKLIKFEKSSREKRSYKVIQTDLLSFKSPSHSENDRIASTRSFIRHDSDKLARLIMLISEMGKYREILKQIT